MASAFTKKLAIQAKSPDSNLDFPLLYFKSPAPIELLRNRNFSKTVGPLTNSHIKFYNIPTSSNFFHSIYIFFFYYNFFFCFLANNKEIVFCKAIFSVFIKDFCISWLEKRKKDRKKFNKYNFSCKTHTRLKCTHTCCLKIQNGK